MCFKPETFLNPENSPYRTNEVIKSSNSSKIQRKHFVFVNNKLKLLGLNVSFLNFIFTNKKKRKKPNRHTKTRKQLQLSSFDTLKAPVATFRLNVHYNTICCV